MTVSLFAASGVDDDPGDLEWPVEHCEVAGVDPETSSSSDDICGDESRQSDEGVETKVSYRPCWRAGIVNSIS